MLNRLVKLLSLPAVALILIVSLAGCGKSQQPATENPSTENPTTESRIIIAGSTSMQPLSEELTTEFMAKNPNIKIDVQGGGSTAGIQAVNSGLAQIGSSSRELEPAEKNLKETLVAIDGIAIIVNPANSVKDLSTEQVKKIYEGKITKWDQIGGAAKPINVVTREAGSGTRSAFEELIMGKDNPILDKAIVQNSTGAVRTAVASDPQAIGFISAANIDNTIKAVTIEGVEPTIANIGAGTYKISRPFLYLTKEEPTGAVKTFLDFVLSSEGQHIVETSGLVKAK